MPVNDQTPAPSRRFLPPSSSTSSKPWTSSARKPPFSFSQSNFTPSSTSPFTYSSRFATPARAKEEDIDTSFEDASSSPSRASGVPFTAHGKDDIYDEDDYTHDPSSTDASSLLKFQRGSLHVEDDFEIVGHNETESVYTGQRDRFDPVTPSSKRRKISTLSQQPMNAIDISSSEPEDEALNKTGDETDPERDHDHLSPQLDTPPMPSRFKTPMPKAEATKLPQQKILFKPFARDNHLSAEAGSILPDAFSPSRRKGKREYVSGGLANTVRNWVLSAATEESQRSRQDPKLIEVTSASMDRSGRLIQVVDVSGKHWLLVGEPSRGHATTAATLRRIRERGTVYVRGTHTTWRLPLMQQSRESDVFVAAQWDIA